ncbi:radical SAM protein [Wukongibacter sp. M2B1]|uniref:radical SAM protein n=1 Tax=Wukongibacter sp. M2B1 TaxID=3088895 RepID=UPI003D7A39B1
MKFSRFNIIKKLKDESIVYNTRSCGVISLNKEYEQEMHNYIKGKTCNKEDLIEALSHGRMIIEEDRDEISELKLINRLARFNSSHLSLTLAPTLNCNFSCPYCFEEGYRNNTMDRQVIENVIKFVHEHVDNIKFLNVAWYGGEPLIALDIIEEFSKSFIKLTGNNISYTAGMVTNGYLLTKDVAKKLKEFNVKSIQVTLDGNKDAHDKRRSLINGNPTYDRIISNIKDCMDIIPLTIRINIDESNIDEIDELLEEFHKNGFGNKVDFYLAQVQNDNCTCSNSDCISLNDFSKKEIDFYSKAIDKKIYSAKIEKPSTAICGAVSANTYVIDPLGDIYKCWKNIGRKEHIVGNVINGMNTKELTKWMLYDPFKDEECTSCNIFPLCMGGCPYSKILTEQKQCRAIRFNVSDTLNLFCRSKQVMKSC